MNDEKLSLPDAALAQQAIESLAVGMLRALRVSQSSPSYEEDKEKAEWSLGALAHAITEHHKRAFKKALLKTLEAFGKTDEAMDKGLSVLSPSDLTKMFVSTMSSMMEKSYRDFPDREYLVVPRFPNAATTTALSAVLKFSPAADKTRITYDLYRIVTAVGSITSFSAAPVAPLGDSPKETFSVLAENGTNNWNVPLERII